MNGRMSPDDAKTVHFREKDRTLRGEHAYVEVRYDDEVRKDIDEIVTTQVHLERMDTNQIWMSVCGLHVWITAHKGKINVICLPETADRVAVVKTT